MTDASCHQLEIRRSSCGRTPFWQFINNDKQHLGQPHWSQTAGLSFDHLQIQTHAGLRQPGPQCRVDGQEVPSYSFQSFPHTGKRGCVLLCCRIFFFQRHFLCSVRVNEPSAATDGNNQHWLYARVVKTWQICTIQHLKRQLLWYYGLRHHFWLPFLRWCCVMNSMFCYFISGWKHDTSFCHLSFLLIYNYFRHGPEGLKKVANPWW